MIISPQAPVSKTIAIVSLESDTINVRFPERLDAFNQLIKQHCFIWQWPLWTRNVSGLALPARERCIELCYNLIDAGFIIDCPGDLVQDIIDCNFQPEQKRWIMRRGKGQYKGWFVFHWPYGDDFYHRAKSITGAQYDRSCKNVVIPIEYYNDVLDFAEIHGFKLTNKALELVELAKSQENDILVVSLKPRKKPKPKQNDSNKIPVELLDL